MSLDSDVLHDEQEHMDRIVRIMCQRTGVDFGQYRAGTIRRRVANRMLGVGVSSCADYAELLHRQQSETWRLLDRLTIKVSRFLRDRSVFDHLRDHVVPTWRHLDRPIRTWSAGCAGGEEAYSLAMLLEQSGLPGSVLASDIDEGALNSARLGMYRPDALCELQAEEITFCFDAKPEHEQEHRVRNRLRRRVQFYRHDLTCEQLPAHGLFDLICCRNVLIYLRPAVQHRVMRSLIDALAPGGHLCLGGAEWPAAEFQHKLHALPRFLRTFARRSDDGNNSS